MYTALNPYQRNLFFAIDGDQNRVSLPGQNSESKELEYICVLNGTHISHLPFLKAQESSWKMKQKHHKIQR